MPTAEWQWLGIDVDHWLKLLSLAGTALVWYLDRRRKPRLHAYFTHGASHAIQPPQGAVFHLNTHSLQVRNAGHAPATNVRITHVLFPAHTTIQVWPQVPHTLTANPPNGNELVFERLRAGEQLSISYLYPGPNTIDHFGTMVRYDDGFAEFYPIQHARIIPRWARLLVYYLLSAGLVLTIYTVSKVALFLFLLV